MEKREYFIEIMKSGPVPKGQMPISKKGKIKIFPTNETYLHQLFANYGWVITQMAPMNLNKVKSLG